MAVNLKGIGKDGRLELSASIYKQLVAQRLELSTWSLPKRWERQGLMRRICDKADEIKAHPVEFILSQFDQLDELACLQSFNIAYPPLQAFLTTRAANRYEKWKRAGARPKKVTVKNIGARIEYDVRIIGLLRPGLSRLAILLSSGIVSVWYVAVRRDLGYLNEDEAYALLSLCPKRIREEYASALLFVNSRNEKEKQWLLDVLNGLEKA